MFFWMFVVVIECAFAFRIINRNCHVQAESYAESSVFESNFFEQYDDFFAGAAPPFTFMGTTRFGVQHISSKP